MIIGVALVVDELHKGQRLVFRYPGSLPSHIFRGRGGCVMQGIEKLYNQYFSIGPDNFAKLFRPKVGLFNKILEISIDDLVYSSFPFQCPAVTSELSSSSSETIITMVNVVITSVSFKAMKKLNRNAEYRCRKRGPCKIAGSSSTVTMPYAGGENAVAAAVGLSFDPLDNGLCSHVLQRLVQ
jgi:hypothetical protein